MVIGGAQAKADATFDVVNPSTSEVMAVVGEICENGIKKTLEAAEQGFAVWSKMSPAQRRALILKYAEVLEANQDRIVTLLREETEIGRAHV